MEDEKERRDTNDIAVALTDLAGKTAQEAAMLMLLKGGEAI